MNYGILKNRQLEDVCKERGIEPVMGDDGQYINRSATVAKLKEWDKENGEAEVVTQDVEKEPEGPKMVKVVFHRQDGASGSQYVFIGCNGKDLYIPYDLEVEIPEEHLKVIDDAVEIVMVQQKHATGMMQQYEKRVHRYSYNEVR